MSKHSRIEAPKIKTRREARVALQAEVTLRRGGHSPFAVQAFDASPHGCKVEFVERPMLDEQVWIRFEGIASVEARVCWVDGFNAGLEFARPIHAAVFETLIARLK